MRSSNETIQFPFHGSCPKCHHLHTNKLVPLSLNFFKHVRFRCDICDHQIFGIGRTSTQTTLASVDSIPSPQLSNRNSSIFRPSFRPVCISLPAEELQTTHLISPENPAPQTPLSTIDEANTPAGRSRSTSNLQSPNDASVRPEGTTISSPVGERENSIVRRQPSPEPTELPRPFQGGRHPFSKLKNVLHRAVHRKSDPGGKVWEFFGIIKIRIPTRRNTNGPVTPYSHPPHRAGVEYPDLAHRGNTPSAEATRIPSQAPTRDLPSHHTDFSPDPTARIMDSTAREVGNPARESGSTTRNPGLTVSESEAGVDASQPGEPDDISSPSTNAGQPIAEQGAVEIKRDRIRARRREKTLQSQTAAQPVCHCHPGCHCHGVNRASGSDVASETHGTPKSSLEVPDHYLSAPGSRGQLLQTPAGATQLSGIGGHSGLSRHSTTPSAQTQAHRLSQATTAHTGSSSSISLTSHLGQPLSRQLGSPLRSRSPEAIQPQGLLYGRPLSLTPSDEGSDPEVFRHSSEETIADVTPAHTSTTGPANIHGSPDRPQPLAQGRSTSLSIQTTNVSMANGLSSSESEDATPQPRSHNELSEGLLTSPQPEPAAISSALRDITSANNFVV